MQWIIPLAASIVLILVVDDRCLVHVGGGTNGAIIAFEMASGGPRWKWEGDGPASSSPVVMTFGGKRQLVTLGAKNLVGLDLDDGVSWP